MLIIIQYGNVDAIESLIRNWGIIYFSASQSIFSPVLGYIKGFKTNFILFFS